MTLGFLGFFIVPSWFILIEWWRCLLPVDWCPGHTFCPNEWPDGLCRTLFRRSDRRNLRAQRIDSAWFRGSFHRPSRTSTCLRSSHPVSSAVMCLQLKIICKSHLHHLSEIIYASSYWKLPVSRLSDKHLHIVFLRIISTSSFWQSPLHHIFEVIYKFIVLVNRYINFHKIICASSLWELSVHRLNIIFVKIVCKSSSENRMYIKFLKIICASSSELHLYIIFLCSVVGPYGIVLGLKSNDYRSELSEQTLSMSPNSWTW